MNVLFSFKQLRTLLAMLAMMIFSFPDAVADAPSLIIKDLGEGHCLVQINTNQRYLLLPVEEVMPDVRVSMIVNNKEVKAADVRLAVNRVDYFVPLDLSGYTGKNVLLKFKLGSNDPVRGKLSAVCCKEMKLADTFDTGNREKFRPTYHFSPLYGWMNDPNGMVYKDGEYHLFYQYNPYGSKWGNMSWGHAISKDLVNWQHLPVAIAPDALGTIFSGSAVVDTDNTAGFGAGAIIAIYTQNSDRQVQSIAYSTDNGRTFTKYENNPVLTSEARDFRDPKVFWYAPEKKWVMIVSADKEMRFYSSQDLKDWTYMSAFGEGYGVQPSQFECPDMVELPVNGDVNNKKWALIVNINPGCLFGGSATQYFVGDFNGKEFICDTKPEEVKWMDWGKDHYATVCFSNTGDRVIAMPWMSNWQYANIVPTQQFRSANALPRELSMYSEGKNVYLAVNPIKELDAIRKETKEIDNFAVQPDKEVEMNTLFENNDGAFEIDMKVSVDGSGVAGFKLMNSKGEYVDIYLEQTTGKLVMDRVHSGIVDFGKNSIPHEKEAHDNRIANSINYVDDFALATWGPLSADKEHSLRIYVDKCSVEIFLDGGKVAMTNLVFPNEPYNSLHFYSKDGSYRVDSLKLYKLAL